MTYTQAAVERAMKVYEVLVQALKERQPWIHVAEVLGVSARAEPTVSSPPRTAKATHLADSVGRGCHRFAMKASWAVGIFVFLGLSLGLSANSLARHVPEATFTTLDPPGALGTLVSDINSAGQIVGWYFDDRSGVLHGFLRNPDGTFVSIDAIGSRF